jgi:hypothetical protein
MSTATKAAAAIAALATAIALEPARAGSVTYEATVWASGLNSPRGLAFDPGGALWVTEAGYADGSTAPSTRVRSDTLIYNETGSLTRIAGGVQTRPITGLPSLFVLATGQMDAGPADVFFDAGGAMSLLISGGGNVVVRGTDLAPVGYQFGRLLRPGGAVDVAAHELANNPGGGAVDSNPWRVAPGFGGTLATDAAANALLRVADDGSIGTVATFGARNLGGPRPTEAVPTGVEIGPDGAAYVAELTGFPFIPGSSRIHRVESDGSQSVFASAFTMLIDIAFDADGDLYALGYDSNGLLAPGGEGQLWKVARDGSASLVWSEGLMQPTGLAVGPDGAAYVSNIGNGAGLGQVLRIAPVSSAATLPLLLLGLTGLRIVGRRREVSAAV